MMSALCASRAIHFRAHHMSFPIYSAPSPAVAASLRLGPTPETIAVSASGAVLGSWNGAYVGGTKAALENLLSISLRHAETP
jgi:hypothetical protein